MLTAGKGLLLITIPDNRIARSLIWLAIVTLGHGLSLEACGRVSILSDGSHIEPLEGRGCCCATSQLPTHNCPSCRSFCRCGMNCKCGPSKKTIPSSPLFVEDCSFEKWPTNAVGRVVVAIPCQSLRITNRASGCGAVAGLDCCIFLCRLTL
jgi:hypothetical protein